MAAVVIDPKYGFRMAGGTNPTAANINAAAGDMGLEVADEHWLNVVCGGLPAAGAGFRTVPGGWRRIEMLLWQTCRIPQLSAIGHREWHRITVTLLAMGQAFERACTRGLAWDLVSSIRHVSHRRDRRGEPLRANERLAGVSAAREGAPRHRSDASAVHLARR